MRSWRDSKRLSWQRRPPRVGGGDHRVQVRAQEQALVERDRLVLDERVLLALGGLDARLDGRELRRADGDLLLEELDLVGDVGGDVLDDPGSERVRSRLDLARAGVALDPDLDQRVDPAHLAGGEELTGRDRRSQLGHGDAGRVRDVAENGFGADDLTDRARVRREALDLPAAERGERLAEVDDGLRAPHRASGEREHETDDRADEEASDRKPPALLDALPGRCEIDLLLAFELGRGAAVSHGPISGP